VWPPPPSVPAMLSLDFLDDVRRMNKRQVPSRGGEGPGAWGREGGPGRGAEPGRAGPRSLTPPPPAAVLPGAELRHDRLVRPHDLEGADGGDGQREPHRGGAEVNPALGGSEQNVRRGQRARGPQSPLRVRGGQRARGPQRVPAPWVGGWGAGSLTQRQHLAVCCCQPVASAPVSWVLRPGSGEPWRERDPGIWCAAAEAPPETLGPVSGSNLRTGGLEAGGLARAMTLWLDQIVPV